MTSFLNRFFILLPWVLIVIIVIDNEMRKTHAPVNARASTPRPHVTQNQPALPVIYAITPTYARPVQKAELTRLAHAFRQVPRFHWIIVEDSTKRTELVSRFLAQCGVPYTHLHVFTLPEVKGIWAPRATEQRNAALTWLRQHRNRRDAGVVFFADDDNTYSLELFEEVTPHSLCHLYVYCAPCSALCSAAEEVQSADPTGNFSRQKKKKKK
ncbi:uncharacterized protein V6R79_026420 [Siganus canaliculatus]